MKAATLARVLAALAAVVATTVAFAPSAGARARPPHAAPACDTSWTGIGNDEDWFNADNWSNGVPDSSKPSG